MVSHPHAADVLSEHRRNLNEQHHDECRAPLFEAGKRRKLSAFLWLTLLLGLGFLAAQLFWFGGNWWLREFIFPGRPHSSFFYLFTGCTAFICWAEFWD